MMEYIEGLITAFGTPTVVIVLIYFVYKINSDNKKDHDVLMKQLARDSEHLHEITLMSLRSGIANPDLPRSVRLQMFDEYKKKGGNSWVEEYVENHLLSEDDHPHRRYTDE